jgi:hypothetical protein
MRGGGTYPIQFCMAISLVTDIFAGLIGHEHVNDGPEFPIGHSAPCVLYFSPTYMVIRFALRVYTVRLTTGITRR